MAKNEIATTGFNYESLDRETASKLRYYAKNGHGLVRKNMIRFIAEFGEVLSEGRKLLASHGDGTFCKWATTEFDLSKQTIYNYVNAWEKSLSNGWTNFANLTPTALYLLTSDDTPKSVREKVLRLAAKQETITKSDIEKLLPSGNKAKGAKPGPADEVLASLPKSEQKQAMAEAVELAGGGTPTKEQLEAVVEMRLEKAGDAESEWVPSELDEPEEEEEPVAEETGLTVFQAQGCFKQWQETIRHMMSDRVGIDAFREAFPGPLGDRTIDSAKGLFEALGAWRKGIK